MILETKSQETTLRYVFALHSDGYKNIGDLTYGDYLYVSDSPKGYYFTNRRDNNPLTQITSDSDFFHNFGPKVEIPGHSGIKDKDRKVSYMEVPPEYIHLMAKRMSANKDKYPPFNWKKDINPLLLIDSTKRHLADLEMLVNRKYPLHNPSETMDDHLAAIGCNMFMLKYAIDKDDFNK